MEENQFKKLCDACDKMLLRHNVALVRIALPWLHVIREHPVFLKEYEEIIQDKIIQKDFSSFAIGYFSRSILKLGKMLFQKAKWWSASSEEKQTTDILFVSHILKESQAGDNKDFYFGDLAESLGDKGYKSAFALINHTDVLGNKLAERWKSAKVPRYILSDSLELSLELGFQLDSNRESIKLKKEAERSGDALFMRAAYKAAYELRQGRAIQNLRIGKQIQKLVKEINPRTIITTYEGHAWERVVFAQARSANPNIYCIGYQHAAIFRLQHSIRRNLDSRFNPDKIFTAGSVSFGQLKASTGLKDVSIEILGSERGAQLEVQNKTSDGDSACLVIPEGFVSECIILFHFSLECARRCPDVKFIWRLHPLLSFAEIKKEMTLDALPDNITLSTSPIEDDILQSKWALYRGTTAIVQAIKAGIIPLYYDDGSMVIDPLYEVKNKNSLRNSDDFLNVINDNSIDGGNFELNCIKEYAENYYTPFNLKVLLEQLNCNKKYVETQSSYR